MLGATLVLASMTALGTGGRELAADDDDRTDKETLGQTYVGAAAVHHLLGLNPADFHPECHTLIISAQMFSHDEANT